MRGIDLGWSACPACHQVVKVGRAKRKRAALCPRCGSEVHLRHPDIVQQTWALVIASIIFYIPANMLPMMHVETFAGTESDTIMSGVIYFVESGSYLIAFVIFVASIIVPTLKLLILVYLLISVQRGSTRFRSQRKRLYQLTEIVGRWSMVDVYVVGVMVALVHFGGLTEIKAGMGTNFFLLVVIVTMFAAMRFDPKLIWDTKESDANK
jgi:paraquat-inducible protein A